MQALFRKRFIVSQTIHFKPDGLLADKKFRSDRSLLFVGHDFARTGIAPA